MTTEQPSILHLDAAGLRVLAHPLRARLLTALRIDGPATATDLARSLETNTGATSYHLRKLASVGLVEEVEGGQRRERRWQAATQMHAWDESDVVDDPDGQAATAWLRRTYLRFFVDGYEGWLEVQRTWPIEWRDAAGSSDYPLHVSAARLAAFNAEVEALIGRYRELPDPDATTPTDVPTDEERVQVYVFAFPMDARPR